jgi:putative thioredoxin
MQPRDFSLYGAVDLGARQAAAQRRQQTAQSGGPAASNGGTVIEVTEETFNTDVVERSRTTPVIMDLWAEWCGPCKQLSPVLEKLAAEAAGQWILAKVDVDANPQLSAALQVQSIPMVVAVLGGQLVDGFLGAMPEAQVRQWISQVLAAAEKAGMQLTGPAVAEAEAEDEAGDQEGDAQAGERRGGEGREGAVPPGAGGIPAGRPGAPGGPPGGYGPGGPGGPQVPPAYAEARAAMERGDLDGAARAFESELANSPGDPVAKTGLAQVNLIRRISSYDQAKVRKEAAEHPDDVQAQSQVADIDLASGRIEEAFDRLLGVVRRTSGAERDQARAHLVSLFELLPPRDPNVTRARSTLSALLF